MHNPLDFAGSLPAGIIIVDDSASVLSRNRISSVILSNNRAISIENGLLSARAHTAELQTLIRAASDGTAGPFVMSISRSHHPFPLAILVTPILWTSPETGGGGERRVVAVVITDPALPRVPSRTVLQRLYGFTGAEATVASHLMNGEPLAAVAARLKISPNTARSHLKKLFQKTGTARQSELVWLLLTGPAFLWIDETDAGPRLRAAGTADK